MSFCGAEGIRTPGLLDAIQALYQLSYGPQEPERVLSGEYNLGS